MSQFTSLVFWLLLGVERGSYGLWGKNPFPRLLIGFGIINEIIHNPLAKSNRLKDMNVQLHEPGMGEAGKFWASCMYGFGLHLGARVFKKMQFALTIGVAPL
jgi:hypothetical protein